MTRPDPPQQHGWLSSVVPELPLSQSPGMSVQSNQTINFQLTLQGWSPGVCIFHTLSPDDSNSSFISKTSPRNSQMWDFQNTHFSSLPQSHGIISEHFNINVIIHTTTHKLTFLPATCQGEALPVHISDPLLLLLHTRPSPSQWTNNLKINNVLCPTYPPTPTKSALQPKPHSNPTTCISSISQPPGNSTSCSASTDHSLSRALPLGSRGTYPAPAGASAHSAGCHPQATLPFPVQTGLMT